MVEIVQERDVEPPGKPRKKGSDVLMKPAGQMPTQKQLYKLSQFDTQTLLQGQLMALPVQLAS